MRKSIKFVVLGYDKSCKELGRNTEGDCEKNLIWKESDSLLSDNKYGSIEKLNNLVKNLRRTSKLEVHDSVVQEQRTNECIEKAEVEEGMKERIKECLICYIDQ